MAAGIPHYIGGERWNDAMGSLRYCSFNVHFLPSCIVAFVFTLYLTGRTGLLCMYLFLKEEDISFEELRRTEN